MGVGGDFDYCGPRLLVVVDVAFCSSNASCPRLRRPLEAVGFWGGPHATNAPGGGHHSRGT